MLIRIEKPITFSLTGQRAHNEDYVHPVDEHSRLFMVCDGVGGWDQGEVASRLVAQAVAQHFTQNPTSNPTAAYLHAALASAHAALAGHLRQNPLLSRVGSTLALLDLTGAGAIVAHVGDSRVYHLRGGRIMHQTQDHKYVHDLVAEGIITEEQALNHPRRNTLSRSVSVHSGQIPPRMDEAEVTYLKDVEQGDYFFLCTDGVLEQVDDELLTWLFAQHHSPQDIVAQVLERCRDLTRDNYSGCLVRVGGISRENATSTFEN